MNASVFVCNSTFSCSNFGWCSNGICSCRIGTRGSDCSQRIMQMESPDLMLAERIVFPILGFFFSLIPIAVLLYSFHLQNGSTSQFPEAKRRSLLFKVLFFFFFFSSFLCSLFFFFLILVLAIAVRSCLSNDCPFLWDDILRSWAKFGWSGFTFRRFRHISFPEPLHWIHLFVWHGWARNLDSGGFLKKFVRR